MKKNKYIFCIGDDFVITYAFNKLEAFMNARLMGYKGDINGIRLHSNA